MTIIPCIKCQGEGCEACGGSGHQKCDNRRCTELAVGFNDDGEALCQDCLMEWTMAEVDEERRQEDYRGAGVTGSVGYRE